MHHTVHPLDPVLGTPALVAIEAFSDNYIWALHNGQQAWVVDPGDEVPVLDWLDEQGLQLQGVLVTHHHADHTGGVAELMAHTGAQAWGPALERLPHGVQPVAEPDTVSVLGLSFAVLDVPGHTAGHIAFVGAWAHASQGQQPVVFCGDTLFSGGCGRLFEGTPADMLGSLDKLAALPAHTWVCCAHEYTLGNLRFARVADPLNTTLAAHEQHCQARRRQQLPTLPSHIGLERAINPFLRTREPALRQVALQRNPQAHRDHDILGVLREWKNTF